jgi:hypothetical protein
MLLLGIGLVIGVLFFHSWRADKPINISGVTVRPSADVHIGDPVTLTVSAEVPWHRRPIREPDVSVVEGRQLVGKTPMRLAGVGVGRWTWVTEITLQATGFETDGETSVRLFFTADRSRHSKPVVVALSFPDVIPRNLAQEGDGLAVAGAVGPRPQEKERTWIYWVGLAAVLVAVAGVLLVVLRGNGLQHGAPPKLPPWEEAERALQDLEQRLPLAADVFFQELTDIIRRYIEDRFAVPATERTTPEFMAVVRAGDWLNLNQGERLESFLVRADRVKFARAAATVEQMTGALAAGTGFVVETRPDMQASAAPGEAGSGQLAEHSQPSDGSDPTSDGEGAG